jgi:hypothetical protein
MAPTISSPRTAASWSTMLKTMQTWLEDGLANFGLLLAGREVEHGVRFGEALDPRFGVLADQAVAVDLPAPDIIAAEIVENLEAALTQFRSVALAIGAEAASDLMPTE